MDYSERKKSFTFPKIWSFFFNIKESNLDILFFTEKKNLRQLNFNWK